MSCSLVVVKVSLIFVVINKIVYAGWQKPVAKAEGAVNDTTVKIVEVDTAAYGIGYLQASARGI